MRGLRAEIAGGGIAGLAVGTMLARQGWSVRIHERNDAIREVGAGVYLRNNPLKVLEWLGVSERIRSQGVVLERSQMRDRRGGVIQDHALTAERRVWICPREVLIRALDDEARRAGVDIALGSRVTGASPDGVLRTEDSQFEADLVIGADGILSAVRDSIGVGIYQTFLPTLATRYMPLTGGLGLGNLPQTNMYWSGRRRVGISPCNDRDSYVFMICPESDKEGSAIPMDVDSWANSFPVLKDAFSAIAAFPAIQHNYAVAKCRDWHKGRVAIIGDAAHGLPPLLGQGAGLALSNAFALAHTVGSDSAADVPRHLAEWEHQYRGFADQTQKWSLRLDRITNRWPSSLLAVRKAAIWVLGMRPFQMRMRVADGFPIGTTAGSTSS